MMSNYEKYIGVFKDLFEVTDEVAVSLKYQEIEAWDSVGHMNLIAQIEDAFGIEMEADDIIEFSSFGIGKEILADKYHIEF